MNRFKVVGPVQGHCTGGFACVADPILRVVAEIAEKDRFRTASRANPVSVSCGPQAISDG